MSNRTITCDTPEYETMDEISAHASDLIRFSTWLINEPANKFARDRLEQAYLMTKVYIESILEETA
jgi:hypothetical protein